jgi:hypothetical protein
MVMHDAPALAPQLLHVAQDPPTGLSGHPPQLACCENIIRTQDRVRLAQKAPKAVFTPKNAQSKRLASSTASIWRDRPLESVMPAFITPLPSITGLAPAYSCAEGIRFVISGNLFTRDYLLEGITRSQPWASLTEKEAAAIKGSLLKHGKSLLAVNKPNEAQTEKTFIYPVLDALGWTDIEVQQTLSTKGRKQVPDALLFADTAARDRAVAEKDHWRRYQFGLAVIEAKRWGRALDRADKRDPGEDGVFIHADAAIP